MSEYTQPANAIEWPHHSSQTFVNLVSAFNSFIIRMQALGTCGSSVPGFDNWSCCEAHRDLNREFGRLQAAATRFVKESAGVFPSFYHSPQILSCLWWRNHGMVFNPKSKTVTFPDGRTSALTHPCRDFTNEELLEAFMAYSPLDLRDLISSVSVDDPTGNIIVVYGDAATSFWLVGDFWGRRIDWRLPEA